MLKSGYVNVPVNGKIEQLHYRYDDEAAAYIFDRDNEDVKNIVTQKGWELSERSDTGIYF